MASIHQVPPKSSTEFSHEKPLFLNVYFIGVLIRFNYLIKKAKHSDINVSGNKYNQVLISKQLYR